MAVASAGVDVQLYTHMKLPSSRMAYIKVRVVGWDVANAILPSPLCTDPMLPLGATLVIFKATLDSLYVALKDNGQVSETGDYVTKQLATVSVLLDKSMPTLAALYQTISFGEGGR